MKIREKIKTIKDMFLSNWNNLDKLEILKICRIGAIACLKKVDYNDVENYNINVFGDFLVELCYVLRCNQVEAEKTKSKVKSILQSNPIYIEAAYLADDVYGKEERKIQGGWEKEKYNIPNTNGEKRYCLYSRSKKNNPKEYIFVIAGSINYEDWGNNLQQLYGASSHYEDSIEYAANLAKKIKEEGASLIFVGHSKGGGEAICCALATGCKAIAFNPAAVSRDTKDKLSQSQNCNIDKLVTSFIITNDPLNWLQDSSKRFPSMGRLVPTTEGTRYYLHKNREKLHKTHSMGFMIDIMEEYCV